MSRGEKREGREKEEGEKVFQNFTCIKDFMELSLANATEALLKRIKLYGKPPWKGSQRFIQISPVQTIMTNSQI